MLQVHEKLLATEFTRLPLPVRKLYLNQPLFIESVSPEGEGYRLSKPENLDQEADTALFPKLGIKSWRDKGTLGIIHKGQKVLDRIERLLARPTPTQRQVAQAWVKNKMPLNLYLSSYLDFTEVSEIRFLVNRHQCRRTSFCFRGKLGNSYKSMVSKSRDIAEKVGNQLPDRSHIIELAYLPNDEIRVIEINPGLTPSDIQLLMEHS